MSSAGSTLSLTEGGPFDRLLRRFRLRTSRGMRRTYWLGLILWAPIAITELVRSALGYRADLLMSDFSVHTRLLFTLPMLLASEPLLERATRSAIEGLYHGQFCDRRLIDRIVDRAERLRDSRVELVLLAVAFGGGLLTLLKVFGPSGLFSGAAELEWSFSRLWYGVIALPLVQFLMLRWMWRWLIWSDVLARLARLPLAVLATHADLACGLNPLVRPVSGFTGFVMAISGILAGAWGTKLFYGQVTVTGLLVPLAVFLVVAIVVALGPLLALSGHLYRGRRRTLAQYGDFVRNYTQRFHAKWVAGSPHTVDGDLLGTPDISALCDLGSAYQVITKTRLFVFGPRTVMSVWAAGIIPMIPVFASQLTVEQVLKRIVSTVLGGFPFGF
jgi:hypothetical protein